MHKIYITIVALLAAVSAVAQESEEVYSFLRLPVSTHAAALGGDNISLPDDDASLIFHNPALIANTTSKTLCLDFMTYMEGARTASAAFVKSAGKRGTWGASAQFMDYGSMKQTDEANQQMGDFSARDVAVAGTFTYLLGRAVSGGVTARFISSTIGSYSSAAVAFDLGVNWFIEDKELSLSAVAKNVGGQVAAYDDEFERIPLDLQVGVTKHLVGSPLRLSATLSRLNNWDQGLIKHLTVGADLLLGNGIYVAAGYNFRRSSEMKITDDEGSVNHGAGLSLGGGLQLQRFKLHVAYAKYHVSASSLLVTAAYSL